MKYWTVRSKLEGVHQFILTSRLVPAVQSVQRIQVTKDGLRIRIQMRISRIRISFRMQMSRYGLGEAGVGNNKRTRCVGSLWVTLGSTIGHLRVTRSYLMHFYFSCFKQK